MNMSTHEDEGLGRSKSIYRLSAMAELGVHESMEFLAVTDRKKLWKQFIGVCETTAYVAHVKKNPRAMDNVLLACSSV